MSAEQYRFSHEAMTTEFEIIISGYDNEFARHAAHTAFQEIDRLEDMLTRFDPGSEVGQINLMKPGDSRKTTPEVMECLLAALWVHSETSGAFDITVGAVMDCWRGEEGYIQAHGPSEEAMGSAMSRSGIDRLVLDADGLVVGVVQGSGGNNEAGIDIDLGGIGKGFALDKVAEILEELNAENVMFHGGASTILATGRDPTIEEDGWFVGMGYLGAERVGHKELLLKNQALSRSGTDAKGDHILDPRTGHPCEGHQAAWVVSPSAAIADALSTAFMIMTTEDVNSYCKLHKEIEAYIAPNSSKQSYSSPLKISENMHIITT